LKNKWEIITHFIWN